MALPVADISVECFIFPLLVFLLFLFVLCLSLLFSYMLTEIMLSKHLSKLPSCSCFVQ